MEKVAGMRPFLFAEWDACSMRVGCGFFFSAVKFLRGGLKKVCKKFRKSIAVLNLLVIFANEIKTQTIMTTQEFNNYIKSNEFVPFEFCFMPISEVSAGRFICAFGTFYKVLKSEEFFIRAENLLGEIELISNKIKVSAIINF